MNHRIWTPRVTVAAVVERQNRFLMVREGIDGQLVHNQPAGHLEDGESLLAAVCREVKEETAWTFRPEGLVGIYRWRMPDGGRTYLRFCFHGGCADHDPGQPLDEGIAEAAWLSREALADAPLRSPLVLRCLDDYLAGRRLPLNALQDL
jgi:ADP-ribose pyrophosphatase YjhB (NUDIX family)